MKTPYLCYESLDTARERARRETVRRRALWLLVLLLNIAILASLVLLATVRGWF